jgi:hypothetical protein
LDDGGVRVRVPVGSRIFSSSRRPDRLWGTPYRGYAFIIKAKAYIKTKKEYSILIQKIIFAVPAAVSSP